MPLEFRLLGSLEVERDGCPVSLGGTKERALLALLLLHANEPVSRDILIDGLWTHPPAGAVHALEVHVSALRKRLREPVLRTRPGGYLIEVEPDRLDLQRFETYLREGREALADDDTPRAESLLSEALAVWRGPALADVAFEPVALAEAGRLEEERLCAVEERAAARLRLGRHDELVAELSPLVVENPLRERFRHQLMLALYRAGRQAEALEVYRHGRSLLVEELGIEPGRDLQELEEAILRQDPQLDLPLNGSEQALPEQPAVEALPPDLEVVRPGAPREGGRLVRKTVTVLFCEIGGLTEGIDPELEWQFVERCLKEIQAVAVGYGGVAEKLVGAAAIAVFGLPAAHEDDALRALRAAAEIRERLPVLGTEIGVNLTFRAGIDTGEVVTRSADTLATGEAVSVAERLGRAAQPAEILVGAETSRLVRGLAELEPAGPHDEAFRLRVLRDKPPESAEAPFIGRGRELALLHDAFERVRGGSELHLFTILGPAGIGKSRLVRELVRSLVGSGVVNATGRCPPYGKGITFWPVVEILQQLGDPARVALEQVVAGSSSSIDALGYAVRTTLERIADEQPLVLVIDDLQWAEPPLLDLLEQAELSNHVPILLVCLARPELLETRAAWAGGRPNATTLLLEPLTDEESASLLAALGANLSDEERGNVIARAGGNPLFLEELVAFLREENVGELPPRIKALLQARIDRLPEPERIVLECAAVEGEVFAEDGVRAIVPRLLSPELDDHLAALVRKGLIKHERPRDDDGRTFRFRHQLICDSAYASMPKASRFNLHERFAAWLAGRAGAQAELEELGAYHLERAALIRRDLGVGDAELEARAAQQLAVAGMRARARADLHAVVNLWTRALVLLDEHDPARPDLQVDLALVLLDRGERVGPGALLDDADKMATDPAVVATIDLARLRMRALFDPAAASREIREACARTIPLFETRADHRRLALAWATLAEAESADNRLHETAAAYARAAAEARLAGDRAWEVIALGARLFQLAGNRIPPAEALTQLEALSSEFPGEPLIEPRLHSLRSTIALHERRFEAARAELQAAIALYQDAGYDVYALNHMWWAAEIEIFAGDPNAAERIVLDAISELKRRKLRDPLRGATLFLSYVRLAQHRYGEAAELVEHVEPKNPLDVTFIRYVQALAFAALGAGDDAVSAAREGLAFAESTEDLSFQADAQYALAVALEAAGRPVEALPEAELAARLYHAVGATLYAEQADEVAQRLRARAPAAVRAQT